MVFSLGIGYGNLLNLARFNRFRNNCFNDACLIILGDTLFSILSGFTVFAFLGYISALPNSPELSDFNKGGPELTFDVIMSGFSRDQLVKGALPQVMVVLFSLLLLTLGLDTVLFNLDTVICALTDHFKSLKKNRSKLSVLTLSTRLKMLFSA